MVLVLPEAGSAQQALGIVHWFLKLPPQRATGVRIDFPREKQGKSPGMGGGARNQIVRMVDPLRMLTTRILPLG
jgi:hypothetical protein